MATTLTCGQVYPKTATEVVRVVVDFSGLLRQGEVLTGSPTITSTGITTASPLVNTSVEIVNGRTVEAGKAVIFTLSGGTAGTTYSILVSCGTSASQTRECYINVPVSAS